MIVNNKISLIIPCKNEEAALASMLQKKPAYVDEVIVVDNGSIDNTRVVGKAFGAKIILETRQIGGVGYGYAHQRGMEAATGDIIVTMDGDDTYPIEAIGKVITYMEKSKSDFVSCARFPLSNSRAISFVRQFGVFVLNTEVSILYGYHIKDILSGMWAVKRECIKKLNAENGEWNFSPEIKLAAITNPEIRFSEYHIDHAMRLNGLSKQNIFKTGFNHLIFILNRRFRFDRFSKKEQLRFVFNYLRFGLQALIAFILLKHR